jgi:rod shape-determining protein MreC
MRDFLRFLYNSHFIVLFLLLESLSIFISVRNTEKSKIFISTANSVSGFFNKKISLFSNYFILNEKNKRLISENEKLKNIISNLELKDIKFSKELEEKGVYYISANVIKNSVHLPYNIITIDKGQKQGIKEDMAVVSDAGVIGIVVNSGRNYSTVISIINLKFGINGKIKRTGYFGDIKWDGQDYRYVYLYDIPVYSSVYKGDEIVTGGLSVIFPEGIKIGTVDSFQKEKESSFYKIKVKLNQDFRNLENVYVIDFKGKDEIMQLQDSTISRFQF